MLEAKKNVQKILLAVVDQEKSLRRERSDKIASLNTAS